jgi:hypothetical protein
MMKLKHGKDFGKHSGTCWRLLFLLGFMPWMRKYRVSSDNSEVSSFRFAAMRLWTGRLRPERASCTQALEDGNENDKNADSKEVNKALQKELDRLQVENDMLRYMIYQPMRHADPKIKASSRRCSLQIAFR